MPFTHSMRTCCGHQVQHSLRVLCCQGQRLGSDHLFHQLSHILHLAAVATLAGRTLAFENGRQRPKLGQLRRVPLAARSVQHILQTGRAATALQWLQHPPNGPPHPAPVRAAAVRTKHSARLLVGSARLLEVSELFSCAGGSGLQTQQSLQRQPRCQQ